MDGWWSDHYSHVIDLIAGFSHTCIASLTHAHTIAKCTLQAPTNWAEFIDSRFRGRPSIKASLPECPWTLECRPEERHVERHVVNRWLGQSNVEEATMMNTSNTNALAGWHFRESTVSVWSVMLVAAIIQIVWHIGCIPACPPKLIMCSHRKWTSQTQSVCRWVQILLLFHPCTPSLPPSVMQQHTLWGVDTLETPLWLTEMQ